MALSWSEHRPPTRGESAYDHVISETPFGQIVIEWKSWKDEPTYSADLPDGNFVCSLTLDEAKQEVQLAWDQMIARAASLCSTGG